MFNLDGEGEPTDNSNTFYDWVMQGQGRIADEGKASDDFTSDKVFQDISFVSFGLGNKTYTHYNAIMKRLTNRLILCGANLISELGLGDDDGSLEEDFLKWKDPAVISVAAYFGLKPIDKQALPHIPIFNLVNKGPINDSLLDTVYCGEITSGDIRRWKKIEIVEDYEVVEKRVDVTFLEVRYSNF